MNGCNACRCPLEPNSFLHCRLCKLDYHYKCLNIKSSQFASLSEEFLLSWVCPACNNVTRRTKSNCDTPVRRNQPLEPEMSLDMSLETNFNTPVRPAGTQTQVPNTSHSSDSSVTMDKISQLMDEKLNTALSYYMTNLRSALKSDIEQMVRTETNKAITELSRDFTTTTDYLCAEQKDLKKCNLQKQIRQMEGKLNNIENLSRSLNIEIQAVPENKNVNVFSLFKKLCEVVNVNIDDSAIHACRRIAKMNSSSTRPRNILVTLASSRLRDLIISSVHRHNKKHRDAPLTAGHLGIDAGSACRIYVAEHLSPEMKTLHAESRKFAQNNNYKYVWVRFGKIFIRKDDTSTAMQIKNSDFLKKLSNPLDIQRN
ncbi:hypothetical protein ABMA28_014608 [Loxostege sticticalis]|uniref:Zinc finger PHD-type domain-containing protein n=1 Tax=Loxostege sticticalis TaxID=481309 RepID=A0ABD0TBM9_LOXSC